MTRKTCHAFNQQNRAPHSHMIAQQHHLSDTDHWYLPDGSPCYEVPRKDGKGMRPATIRDARELGLVPSVTKIIGQLDRPELDQWKILQMVEAGENLRNEPIGTNGWISMVKDEGTRIAREARAAGQIIHAGIDEHIKGESFGSEFAPIADKIIGIIEKMGGKYIEAEKSFATRLYGGYGGKIDIYTPQVITDIKTTEFELIDGAPYKKGKKATLQRMEHCLQLIGYAKGTMPMSSKKMPQLLNVFVSTSTYEVFPVLWEQERIERQLAVWKLLVKLWWINNW